MNADSVLLEVLLIFLMLVINGLFAMTEIAMVSVRKARMQQEAEDGDPAAKRVLTMLETPNRFLSTIQIAITLVGIFAGALGGATIARRLNVWLSGFDVIAPYSEEISLVVVVLLTTYFSLVIGELIPKRIGMNNPDKIAKTMSGPMRFLSRLVSPVVQLLSFSTDIGLRLLGIRKSNELPVTEEEIRVLIEQGTQVGVFDEAEQDMVEGVLRLGDRYVDAIMTPRTEVEWIDLDEPLEEIIQQVIESGHSRFPVAREKLDNVIGILAAKDLLARQLTGENVDLQTLIQPSVFIPDSMSALRVLDMLKESGTQAALVIDEYGGLLGIVTLYDVLRNVVGIIPMIGQAGSPQATQREDGSWLMDGLLSIDAVKEILDIPTLPDETRVGYQTLGGFVMNQLSTIPSVGQNYEWSGFRFEVMDMDGMRVDKVLVTPLEPAGDEARTGVTEPDENQTKTKAS
ncbi:MAG TPA: hemolysin family protein [Anaerolineaceae bacterium]|nr:hemolysin family protein [Anaerolineaceae bacterium]